MGALPASPLPDWLANFIATAGSEEGVKEFERQVDAAILDRIPELASDPVLVADLSASTRSQWKAFLTVMERPAQEVVLPPQAVDLALSIARRGLDLGVLLKVYRVAADATWEYMTQAVSTIPTEEIDRTEALTLLWGRAGRWINESIERLILIDVAEREASLHGALARRSETLQSILRGERISLDQAVQDLGHQVRAHQTCLVLWLDEPAVEQTVAPLEKLAQAIARELNAPRPLTHTAGRRDLWVWLATREAPDLTPLTRVVAAHGAQAAVGDTGRGLAGFRASYQDAIATQKLVVASGNASVVTRHADVKLACLLSENPEAAHRLVEQELGDLAGDEPGLAVFRETLSHYLRNGSNIALTAKELFVHRNTVSYRLAQAEQMVGHPLTERRTEMDVALQFLAWWPRS